jgi:4-aminobutyrate--pyruvate transaminase
MNEQARPNSLAARDIAYCVHPQTNLARHRDVGPLTITHGEGIHVVSDDGRRFIDTNSGLWCSSLGYANERLARAAYEQMRTLGAYHTFRHSTNEAVVLLSEKLVAMAPKPMAKVLLQCSGSEANDTAIKLAWYYHAAKGNPGKYKIIGRERGYHGTSCATTSLSGKRDMHADFHLPLPGFLHAQFPHYYREHEEGETEEEFATRMAEALEALILAEGPDTVAAFFAEPVMGAGGAVVPPRTYFAKVQDVLRRHDILFVADEVICGFGRTGNMWGSQTYGLQPDMITCAKGLSAAMLPISALLVNERIFKVMAQESDRIGAFVHGFTYAGHPVAASVALEVLKIYEEIDIVSHVRSVEPAFLRMLAELEEHPLVGKGSGVGLLGGLELVADKETRKSFAPEVEIANRIDRNGRKHGIILRPLPTRMSYSPPLIITEAEIVEMGRKTRAALDDTYAEIKAL